MLKNVNSGSLISSGGGEGGKGSIDGKTTHFYVHLCVSKRKSEILWLIEGEVFEKIGGGEFIKYENVTLTLISTFPIGKTVKNGM